MMRFFIYVVLGLFIGLVSIGVMASPRNSGMYCTSDRAEAVALLAKRFGEVASAIGLANTGNVVEVFVSPNGSFSITTTMPDGTSCLITGGENWESVPPKPGGQEL